MNVLPDETLPSSTRAVRSHDPRRGAYLTYRNFLRWEAGFTCSFCLLHEADLTEHGAGAAGVMTIEHLELKRPGDRPDLADEYGNCALACRYCNAARSTRPRLRPDGRRLLDPYATAWATHFRNTDGVLEPHAGDADAAYTHSTYRLDDERKVGARRRRERHLSAAMRTLLECPSEIDRLHELAERASPADRIVLHGAARKLNFHLGSAKELLLRYRAVPPDAPKSCRCGDTLAHRLPAWLAAQTRDVPLP